MNVIDLLLGMELRLVLMVITIWAHWRPLELEIAKRDIAELIQMVITFSAPCSPFNLEIEKRDKNELIQMVIAIEAH